MKTFTPSSSKNYLPCFWRFILGNTQRPPGTTSCL